MTVFRAQLVEKGWTVKTDPDGKFRLKNGPWDAVGGFDTQEKAWKWLEKIKEPRSPKDLTKKEMWENKMKAIERAFIRNHN